MTRLVLAATLGANYGIYGPPFELYEHVPRESGSEEYLNSEKYEIKHWDINRPDSLSDFIARVNTIRRENAALQRNDKLAFHPIDNDMILCYSKTTPDLSNIIVTVVNLDSHFTQSGWIDLPLYDLNISEHQAYDIHDLIDDTRYTWYGRRNYVELNPHKCPAHIFRINF